MKKLLFTLLLLPVIVFSQHNKEFENLDVKNKLYVGGDIIYKGETMTASRVFQDSITRLSDSITELRSDIINHTIRVTRIDSYVDTTSYVSVNDTITGFVYLTSSTANAYTSNNSRASLAATSSDSATISYTFPTFLPNGNITGVQISFEYLAIDTGTFITYFQNGSYYGDTLVLPMKLTSDTTVVFGGSNNLLGLDNILDSLIEATTLDESAMISDLMESDTIGITIVASDTTLNIDHIKLRLFYTVAEQVTVTSDDLIIWQDFLYLIPREYAPAEAVEGLIYMDTDHHLYLYNGSQWKQLDN